MGIKTKFNPMGGRSDSDKGNLEDWRYTNLSNGSTLLYEYVGGDWANTVYVPKVKGNAVINNYTSGSTTTASNTPFFNNRNVISVDLQKVPFVSNNMSWAFNNCQYLTEVKNINPNVTNMYVTFSNCRSLNSLIQIPNSVTDMRATFSYCYNLNQNIQIPNSVTSMSDTFGFCHNLNQNIQIPNSVTSLSYTFSNCNTLNQNIQIGNSVTSMLYTFSNCIILNQNIQIPNSVTSMQDTFSNCTNLNQNIQIPSSVTSMVSTFYYCNNLNQNIQIGSSVIDMQTTFYGCSRLNQPIQIPSRVTNMQATFYGCFRLNQPIQIPSSVTNMQSTFFYCTDLNRPITIGTSVTNMNETFYGCQKFNQSITIPNSVVYMYQTFNYCMALNNPVYIGNSVKYLINTFEGCSGFQSNIFIHSSEVADTNSCFVGSGLTKNVIFPLRYINNVNTVTRNTLVTAATGGYAIGTAVGNLVNNTAQNAVFKAYDHVAWEGYNQWAGNGTHWILNKWAGIGKNPGATTITVPNSITSYATYPTAMTYTAFTQNKAITDVTLPDDIPWATQIGNYKNSKSRYGAFNQCTNLEIIHANINSAITVIDYVFENCFNLVVADVNFYNTQATRATALFERCYNLTSYTHPLPTTLTSMWSTFGFTNLSQPSITIPYQVTQLATCFANCGRVPDNIYIDSPKVSNITNFFRARPTTNRTNLYIYFKYSNGVNTPTYNQFKANNVYKGTSGNAAGTEPLYNSTSNIWVYNRGVSPYN